MSASHKLLVGSAITVSALLKNQKIEMQLALLRSQINPHFLFNSLNVIYALAIGKKEETKENEGGKMVLFALTFLHFVNSPSF